MGKLAIKATSRTDSKIISILEQLGGVNRMKLSGNDRTGYYYIADDLTITKINKSELLNDYHILEEYIFTVEQFEKIFPYKVGDIVRHNMSRLMKIIKMRWDVSCSTIKYDICSITNEKDCLSNITVEGLKTPTEIRQKFVHQNTDEDILDMGKISDGYHTFNELYEYRLLYNASFFNELAKQNLYDVHKSKKHSNGEDCFGGEYFVVIAELPTGQISNHYRLKHWDLFQIPEKDKANKWDGHTPQDVANRMREFLKP